MVEKYPYLDIRRSIRPGWYARDIRVNTGRRTNCRLCPQCLTIGHETDFGRTCFNCGAKTDDIVGRWISLNVRIPWWAFWRRRPGYWERRNYEVTQ